MNTKNKPQAEQPTEEARGVDGDLMEAIRRYAFLFALHTQNNTDASRAEADAALARVRALLAAPAAGKKCDGTVGNCPNECSVPCSAVAGTWQGSDMGQDYSGPDCPYDTCDPAACACKQAATGAQGTDWAARAMEAELRLAELKAATGLHGLTNEQIDRILEGFDRRVLQAATGAQGLTWTSVNDRLPPIGTGERVLIYTEGADFAGEQFFDIKADDLYPSPDGEQDTRTEVAAAATHWMPLPYPGITPNQKDA